MSSELGKISPLAQWTVPDGGVNLVFGAGHLHPGGTDVDLQVAVLARGGDHLVAALEEDRVDGSPEGAVRADQQDLHGWKHAPGDIVKSSYFIYSTC